MADYQFGYKIAWLAIRSEDQSRVVDALRLTGCKPVSWEDGIGAAYGEKGAFVSSPAGGWIFVVDRDLMTVDKAPLAEMLTRLSHAFGEAQYFLNYRVSSCHAWVRARQGKIERAYASADGELDWNEGRITPEELAIRLASAEQDAARMQRMAKMKPETYSKEAKELAALAERLAKVTPETFSEDDAEFYPGEDDVVKVAGKWSIDPETLDESLVKDPAGILGMWPKRDGGAREVFEWNTAKGVTLPFGPPPTDPHMPKT